MFSNKTIMSDGEYRFVFDEEVRHYAEKELNETDETRARALTKIKKWIKENPHLNAKENDYDLIPFLRSCKFDIKKTKQKIENFYKMKRDVPEFYLNRDPESEVIQGLVKSGCFLPLKQTIDNRLVILMRIGNYDAKLYDINDLLKASIMIFDMTFRQFERQHIYGFVLLVDMTGSSFEIFKQVSSFTFIKNCVSTMKNFYCRPKMFVYINMPFYLRMPLNLFKTFLPAKMKDRIIAYEEGTEVLDQVINTDMLPPEYGGKGDSVKDLSTYWSNLLLHNREWFLEDEKHAAV